MKKKFRTLLLVSVLGFVMYSCTGGGKVYVDELDKREDGRYYRAGEDKPFSGIAISSNVNGEWEFRSGKEIRSTGFYKNGNKRHEKFNETGKIQYYDPNGNPISSEEYGKSYTPSQGYEN